MQGSLFYFLPLIQFTIAPVKPCQAGNRKMKKTFICLLSVCLVFGSCSAVTNTVQKARHADLFEKGRNLMLDKEFQKAEENFLLALKIAEKQQMIDETVLTKQTLAELYLSSNKYEKTKSHLEEARRFCVDNLNCSPSRLGSIYDFSITLCLSKDHDIVSAEKYVDEVISNKQRLSKDKSKNIVARLNSYAQEMRITGYEKQANDLANRINQIGN